MYLITRLDLPSGDQAAQAAHAAFSFACRYPDSTREWHEQSNFLVLVAAPDEQALIHLAEAAGDRGVRSVVVREPDWDGDPVTAVALEPCAEAKRLCANYPLALKEPAML